MLNQLLSQLGATTKITVGVAMSPGIGLEMIEINLKQRPLKSMLANNWITIILREKLQITTDLEKF